MGALIADEYPRAATQGRLSRVAMLAVEGRRTICTAKDGRQFETEILCRKNLTERAAFQMVSERITMIEVPGLVHLDRAYKVESCVG